MVEAGEDEGDMTGREGRCYGRQAVRGRKGHKKNERDFSCENVQ
jgi:hypothetical protein